MDWKKSIGYGIGIYVIIFILWSVLVAFGQGEASWAWYLSLAVLAVVAHCAGGKLNTKNWAKIIKYSAVWVAVTATLDAVLTTRFTGWEFYNSWEIYASYAILLLVPLTVICCKGRCCSKKVEKESDAPTPDIQQPPSGDFRGN